MSLREGPAEAGGTAAWAGLPRPRWLVGLPRRTLDALERERTCWIVLGVAMAASAVLGLWLTRGTTFFIDEVTYYLANRGFDPTALLSPHNGHLILIPRLMYAAVFKLFGADYLVFRLLEVAAIAVAAGLFFVLAKRRVGPAVALGPSVILLFLGAAWVDTLTPAGITHIYCIIFGLGALLALDRGDRLGDGLACALLVAAVATFSIGLPFAIGTGVLVLLRPDRWRRAWIFVVPLALYGLWLVAAPKLHGLLYLSGTGLQLKNALLIPSFVGEAAAAVVAAITGLSYDFTNPSAGDITDPSWGVVIGAIAFVALVLRLRRGRVPGSLWAAIAILLAFWASTALVSGRPLLGDTPGAGRYVYPGAVVVLLVGVEAIRGVRLSRAAVGLVLAASAFALAGNIALLRDGSPVLRNYAASLRSQFAAIEVARNVVAPDFVPPTGLANLVGPEGARAVLRAFDRNGSIAFSVPQLLAQAEPNREQADATVAEAERIGLTPAPSPARTRSCRRVGGGSQPVDIVVRPPGVLLGSAGAQPVTLRRFADTPTVPVGRLRGGGFDALRVPRDGAAAPWHATVPAGTAVTVCTLGGAP